MTRPPTVGTELRVRKEIEWELWEAAQTTKMALDYGDQDWVSGLFVKAAREIERLRAGLKEIAEGCTCCATDKAKRTLDE